MMRNIELEEGEAYFLQDDDDDENIDPDTDLSYIDRKLENLLGQYQIEFMHGHSAECLGPRHGRYGSFLPVYERSLPVWPNQRSQNHVSSKLPPNLPSKPISESRTATVNTSLPARSVPVPVDRSGKFMSESGISTVNNHFKFENSAEGASNHQQPPKKPIIHKQNSLKFRVKMASKSVLSPDNTAIYSGLGLTMSPTSSPEGTPIENDGTLREERKMESPSFIIKIMTSIPLPNETLISPLHDGLICLMEVDNSLENVLAGVGQEPLNIIHLEGKKEASDETKPKLKDTRKKNSLKLKESSKERKLIQSTKSHKPVQLVKEDEEFPVNSIDFSALRREEIGTLVGKKIVSNTSINAVDAGFKESGKFPDSRPSIVFCKKSVVGCSVEELDNYTKQEQVGIHTVKDEFPLVSSDAVVVEEGNLSKIRSKSEKDKNAIAIPKGEPATNKRNKSGRRANEESKFLKQHVVVKEDLDLVCPKEEGYRKESGKQEKVAKDNEVGLISAKDVDKKHYDVHQEMKHHDSESLASLQQKSFIKAMPHPQMGPSLAEASSSLVKKKSKDCQTVSSTEPLRGRVVGSSGPEGEEVIRGNIPSRSNRGEIDSPKEMKTDRVVAVAENPIENRKEVSSREIVMGPSERESYPSASKMKMQSSSKKAGFANTRPNLEGRMAGDNCLRERFPVGELPLPENASLVPLEMDDWVMCEKCQQWRLLPFGMNPDSLPKEWICSMLTWLPGMNKCSFREDETTHALHALYQPSASGPVLQVQNNQQGYLDGTACAKASAGTQNAGLSELATSADVLVSKSKKKNVIKLETNSAGRSGAQDLHRPVKKDPQHSGGIRNPKNLKKVPLETAGANKNAEGAGGPSKILKKRMAETEVSGVPKKMKKLHQQSGESPSFVKPFPPEVKGESLNHDPDTSRISRDFVPGSSEGLSLKVKNRDRRAMTTIDDVSEKKRKMNHQRQSVDPAEPFGNGQLPPSTLVAGKTSSTERRKDRKTNTSDTEARERSADKGHHRTKGDGHKHNLGRAGDNSQHKGSRVSGNNLEPYHADRIARKTAGSRKSSEKALVLGLSDNTTTSSSSKVSTKVKAKASEVKCSPVGSISSSPLKVSKSGHDKGTKQIVVPYNEPEEMSSRKRLKSSAQDVCVSQEFAPNNEENKDRRSNLSRTTGTISGDANDNLFSKKVSGGRHSTEHRVDPRTKLEVVECYDGKLTQRHNEGGNVASQWKSESRMPNGVHFDGTSSERQKLRAPELGGEKEVSFAHCVPDFEKGSGSNSVSLDKGNGKLSRQVVDDHVNLRHPQHTGHVSKDVEASSSTKKDGFHYAAKTALKEAKDLKHSANRLKTAGSGLSTGIFFQAALKFLHGASLLEPRNSENGRIGEMSSSEVYSSTAKLCEYCAHEYEKCNDMASAALAYKCMEVAYLRVVYYNDVAANRDRMELQMAVRAAPQVESPSSSASDIDNLNNQVAIDSVRDGNSAMDHRNHVISAGNVPKFVRVLSFVHDFNLAMEASRKSQGAFAVANSILSQMGNEEGISSIKRVLDFSFHDVDGLLHLVRLAMEALNN